MKTLTITACLLSLGLTACETSEPAATENTIPDQQVALTTTSLELARVP